MNQKSLWLIFQQKQSVTDHKEARKYSSSLTSAHHNITEILIYEGTH